MRNKGLYTYFGDESSNVNINGAGFDYLRMTSESSTDGVLQYSSLKTVKFNNGTVNFSKSFRQALRNNLNQILNSTTTSSIDLVDVDDTDNPIVGGDYILIDSEVMQVTSVATATLPNTMNVVRAQWGTKAVSHANDSLIYVAQPGFCDHWIGFKAINSTMVIEVQAESNIGDNLTSASNNLINPQISSYYIGVGDSDFVHGSFNHIYLEEPTTTGHPNTYQLMAIRG